MDPRLVEDIWVWMCETRPGGDLLESMELGYDQAAKFVRGVLKSRPTFVTGTRTLQVNRAMRVAAARPLPKVPIEQQLVMVTETPPPKSHTDLHPIWLDALDVLKAPDRLGHQDVHIWLRQAVPIRLVAGELHLWLPQQDYCDWVEENYLDDLVDVLGVDSVRLLCGDARAGPAAASPAPPP